MRYVLEQLEHLRLWLWAALLTPLWAWVQVHFGGFWWSNPFCWICIFWAADWALGSGRALYDGWMHPDEPERGFRPRRALMSVLKLGGYVGGLMVAWGLRDSAGVGGKAVAMCAETGLLLYEASSVFGHLGEISGIAVFRAFSQKAHTASGAEKKETTCPSS